MNYSVIIPFRGSLDLLSKALNSIPDRDDIQIIVVDNNPAAADITCFPHPNYSTLLVLRSDPEKGAGHARNIGLDAATGIFILFLDADDYFTKDAFEHFDKFIDSEYDIVYFDALSIKLDSGESSTRHKMIHKLISDAIISGNDNGLRYKFCNPVSKMILRSLVEEFNVRFQEVPAANDQMFSVWTGHYARKIKAVDSVVYMITEGRKNSSLTKLKDLRNQESRFKVDVYYNSFMKSIGRKDLQCRIYPEIIMSFYKFGFRTGLSWIKYALKNR